jgi:RimJ/RimL family protein N-acetyltransferase
MQQSWRTDSDKLTFIACLPVSLSTENLSESADAPDRMIGDINLFLTLADEDDEGCIGELELMIAPTHARRQGYGRAALLSFMHYISLHLRDILAEYAAGVGGSAGEADKMKLLQLRVKIGSGNVGSIGLFESVGFVKVSESPNYFGELELVFEGFLGEERTQGLLEQCGIEEWKEMSYRREE